MASDYLDELRAFIAFLSSVWGLLGGLSTVFPLSNTIIEVVPLGPPDATPWLGPKFVDPALISALATLGCIYVVFYSFAQRQVIQNIHRRRIRTMATRSFVLGVIVLALYLADFYVVPNYIQRGSLLAPTDPVLFVYDIGLVAFYGGAFMLYTRAFVLLGIMEYLEIEE